MGQYQIQQQRVDDDGFRPRSVLLLLAGTGIVALPQILAHKEPHRLLGIPVPKSKQMQCAVDLIASFREDDVLLLQEIKQACVEGARPHPRFRGLRSCTLLLAKEKKGEGGVGGPPFGDVHRENDSMNYHVLLKDLPNAKVRHSRITKDIVADAIERLDYPAPQCRIVVSGPDSFNNAARGFLGDCGVGSKQITILSA